MEEEEQSQGFLADIKWDCTHAEELLQLQSLDQFQKFLKQDKHKFINQSCQICKIEEETWVCMTCLTFRCSRYKNSCMKEHQGTESHYVGLSISDASFWCVKCEAYVLNSGLQKLQKLFGDVKHGDYIEISVEEGTQNNGNVDKIIEESNITLRPPENVRVQQKELDEETQEVEEIKLDFDPNLQSIFVYGTLQPDHGYAQYNKDLYKDFQIKYTKAFISDYTIYYNFYPTVKPQAGEIAQGYLIQAANFEDFLKRADLIEGYPSYYNRQEVEVSIEQTNQKTQAFVYEMNEDRFDRKNAFHIGQKYMKQDFQKY